MILLRRLGIVGDTLSLSQRRRQHSTLSLSAAAAALNSLSLSAVAALSSLSLSGDSTLLSLCLCGGGTHLSLSQRRRRHYPLSLSAGCSLLSLSLSRRLSLSLSLSLSAGRSLLSLSLSAGGRFLLYLFSQRSGLLRCAWVAEGYCTVLAIVITFALLFGYSRQF